MAASCRVSGTIILIILKNDVIIIFFISLTIHVSRKLVLFVYPNVGNGRFETLPKRGRLSVLVYSGKTTRVYIRLTMPKFLTRGRITMSYSKYKL